MELYFTQIKVITTPSGGIVVYGIDSKGNSNSQYHERKRLKTKNTKK